MPVCASKRDVLELTTLRYIKEADSSTKIISPEKVFCVKVTYYNTLCTLAILKIFICPF